MKKLLQSMYKALGMVPFVHLPIFCRILFFHTSCFPALIFPPFSLTTFILIAASVRYEPMILVSDPAVNHAS